MLVFIVILVMAILVAPVVYSTWKEEDERFEALIQRIQAQGQAFDDISADLTECTALVKETESNRAYTKALRAKLAAYRDLEEILETVKDPH